MKIIKDYPPNYEQICAAIPGVRSIKTAIFTYNGCLYNPGNGNIPPELMAHEETHVKQQVDSDHWWGQYLHDVDFRLDQELEAYRVQYAYAVKHCDRSYRRNLLNFISKSLAGKLYGNLVSKEQAKELIKARKEEL